MSSNLQDEQQAAELETIEQNHQISLGEDLEFLRNCPQFQRLVLDEYLERSVLNSMTLLAHPQVIQSGDRPKIMEDMVAASNFNFFLKMVEDQYQGALNDHNEYDEEEEE